MAKALECPACGAQHSVDGREPSSTFRCEQCGQALKVPASVVVAQAASGASNVTPPPRRRAGVPPSPEVIGATATLSATDTGNGSRPPQSPQPAPPRASAPAARSRAHWYWRLAAWIVAVPIAFVVTAWPAYEFGLIRKDDVLDVFVGSGVGRYTRLALFTLIWALVTAVLVQLLVEGGRWWSRRRRGRRRTASPRGATTGS
jgi:hypothetical protein